MLVVRAVHIVLYYLPCGILLFSFILSNSAQYWDRQWLAEKGAEMLAWERQSKVSLSFHYYSSLSLIHNPDQAQAHIYKHTIWCLTHEDWLSPFFLEWLFSMQSGVLLPCWYSKKNVIKSSHSFWIHSSGIIYEMKKKSFKQGQCPLFYSECIMNYTCIWLHIIIKHVMMTTTLDKKKMSKAEQLKR